MKAIAERIEATREAIGEEADIIVEMHCSKGTKLLISGKLKNNNYEKNGQKIYSNEIVIDSLEFLETKKQDD